MPAIPPMAVNSPAISPVRVALFSAHPVMLTRLAACLPAPAWSASACLVAEPELQDAALHDQCARLMRCPVWVVDVHSQCLLDRLLAELPPEASAPRPRVLAVGAEFPPASALSLLLLGARGLVTYRRLGRELPRAVRYLHAGAYWTSRRLLSALLAELLNRLPAPRRLEPLAHLSPREREVLDLLLQLQSNKEIASRLCISERTVKFHVASLLRKFRTRRRHDLIFRLGRSPELFAPTGSSGGFAGTFSLAAGLA